MPETRWEDRIPRWSDADRTGEPLGHHPSVARGPLAVGLWAAPAVVPSGDGAPDGRDLIIASWDACFEGGVYRFTGLDECLDVAGPGARIPGMFGNVDPVPGATPPLFVGASRERPEILLFSEGGGAPAAFDVHIAWVRGAETLHVVRACDFDGDGVWDLLIGTDDWSDYWPDGREWNDPGYRPYGAAGAWRGGPLRGHVYAARNTGSAARPRFERAVPLTCGGRPLEVYGTAAPAWADFLGRGQPDLVCGDFLDHLWFFRRRGPLEFDRAAAVLGPDGSPLALPQNIHVPVAVTGRAGSGVGRAPALLVGAEDGFVRRLDPVPGPSAVPAYDGPQPVRMPHPPLHPGVEPVPVVCDWSGSGRLDLIVGTAGGWLSWYPDLGGDDELRRYGEPVALRTAAGPIRVQAGERGSIQGPSEMKWGYLSPTAADWDGDGRPDVLASDIMGRHLVFMRTADPAVLEAPRELRYAGAPLRTVWRVRPAVTTWGTAGGAPRYVCVDGDGVLVDFARQNAETLEAKRRLSYADGTPIGFTEDRGGGLGRVKLAVCDWTGSGRGDLLVGTHARASVPPGATGVPRHTHGQATVLVFENVGMPGRPVFAAARQLYSRGRPVRFGMHSCAPAPFNRRGRKAPDLVVGTESGTLLVLRREHLTW
ncbi:MAG TPA: hypothetical protein VKT83_11635 [bacterium]|nr:hypothetical protein [bacterium]